MAKIYRVKEIFYSLQGEGANAGRAALFCRFAGCNLWSGRPADRSRGPGSCSRWCDTDFLGGTDYTLEALVDALENEKRGRDCRFAVLTGGEPMLQIEGDLVRALHRRGFEVAIETNGTIAVSIPEIDWICVSPKAGAPFVQRAGDELKLIFPQTGLMPSDLPIGELGFKHLFLQAMDGPALGANLTAAARYCMDHPQWRLSLQAHKFAGIR
ncbi:MAG TPA: 7-carboxy-7-deazaguanine synthase [Candidatus Binataceae bacterium]|nr:7-carboxy-7-deazaguanine synthase [Candidatus Binataceae bacterium]